MAGNRNRGGGARPTGYLATIAVVFITIAYLTLGLLKIDLPALTQVFTAVWGIWIANIGVETERARRRRDEDRQLAEDKRRDEEDDGDNLTATRKADD